jgi:hypothetical protein
MGREKERIRVVIDSNVAFSFMIKGKIDIAWQIFENVTEREKDGKDPVIR